MVGRDNTFCNGRKCDSEPLFALPQRSSVSFPTAHITKYGKCQKPQSQGCNRTRQVDTGSSNPNTFLIRFPARVTYRIFLLLLLLEKRVNAFHKVEPLVRHH